VAEVGVKAASPAHVEEPSGEPMTPPDAPNRGRGLMTSLAMVGRSTQGEEA